MTHLRESNCPCQTAEARRGRGRDFARFADYPKACGKACCANPRRYPGIDGDGRTQQELRAPDVDDFDLDEDDCRDFAFSSDYDG